MNQIHAQPLGAVIEKLYKQLAPRVNKSGATAAAGTAFVANQPPDGWFATNAGTAAAAVRTGFVQRRHGPACRGFFDYRAPERLRVDLVHAARREPAR